MPASWKVSSKGLRPSALIVPFLKPIVISCFEGVEIGHFLYEEAAPRWALSY
jgi:hypothetical protein